MIHVAVTCIVIYVVFACWTSVVDTLPAAIVATLLTFALFALIAAL